jgi:hypothetical protein
MRHTLSRLLFLPLSALLGTACLIDTGPHTVKDPCDPNPCTQGDKTSCVNEDGNARCLCKPGTIARPSGACEVVSTANCAEHTGDSAEPDDCVSRAVAITSSSTQRQQSIDPIGDYDFFRVDGTLRDIYSVTVEPGPGSLMPRVDVFDQAGVWIISQDGRPKAQVAFKARATAPYYVRVSHSPMDPSAATGAYAITVASLGTDDYGDSSTEATTVVPDVVGTQSPTNRNGNIQYAHDEDWVALSVTRGVRYRIEFDTNRFVPALAAFTRENTKEPVLTARNSPVEFVAESTTTLYLDFYSPDGIATGAYGFRVLRYNN